MPSRVWSFVLRVSIVAAAIGSSAAPVFADAYYDQGVRLFQARNYKTAAQYFEQSMRSSPSDSRPYYYAALNYHYMADWPRAKAAYRQVVDRFPGSDAANLSTAALLKIDPNFKARSGATAGASAVSGASSYASGGGAPSADLASLPNEARVYFEPEGAAMMVATEVNGRNMKMCFDTGAVGVLIGKNQLQTAGINAPAGRPTGYTAGSSTGQAAATWTMNADVKLGPIVRRGFPVTVIENNPTDPLLGQSFFKDFDYSIDGGSKSIHFKKKGGGGGSARVASVSSGGSSNSAPFTWDKVGGNKMVVNIEVNGKQYPVWLDTGNSASALSMNKRDAQRLGLQIPEDAQQVTTGGVTGEGKAARFAVSRIKFGPIEKSDVEIDVKDEDSGGKPLLGQPFLEGWQVTVDNDRQRVNFLRR